MKQLVSRVAGRLGEWGRAGGYFATAYEADTFEAENPIRALIPPLVAFLPGAALTTGTVELAA